MHLWLPRDWQIGVQADLRLRGLQRRRERSVLTVYRELLLARSGLEAQLSRRWVPGDLLFGFVHFAYAKLAEWLACSIVRLVLCILILLQALIDLCSQFLCYFFISTFAKTITFSCFLAVIKFRPNNRLLAIESYSISR